jgi:membrane-associated protease RseP (regulator of RpoE activity)
MKLLLEKVHFLTERTPIMMFGLLTMIYGRWLLSLAVVATVVAHELMHAAAYRHLRIGVEKITFGIIMATTVGTRPARSHTESSITALAGPAGGLVQAMLLVGLYQVWPSLWLLSVAFLVATLNLVNALPIIIVDGCWVWLALISRLGLTARQALFLAPAAVAFTAAAALHLWFYVVVLLVVLVYSLGSLRSLFEAGTPAEGVSESPPVEHAPMSRRHVAAIGTAYAGTIAGLALVTYAIHTAPGFSLAPLL